jgi:tetratricopeptide (TPR) repeat protein
MLVSFIDAAGMDKKDRMKRDNSRRAMTRSRAWCLWATVVLAAVSACVPSRGAVKVDARSSDRLVAADALVRTGCYDCLLAAYREYDALRLNAHVRDRAALGAVRAAALLAIRERELGLDDSGYLKRAQELAAESDTVPVTVGTLLDIADLLPSRGMGRPYELNVSRRETAVRNRSSYTESLQEHDSDDPLSAYLWIAFNCTYVAGGPKAIAEWLGGVPDWQKTPLVAFRSATCGAYNSGALAGLVESDARFVEIHYLLGLAAMLEGKIDDALEHLQKAYAWQPQWPALTETIASAYLTVEEFDRSIDFFERTLALVPDSPESLLGKARALTYLGRFSDSLLTLERLLSLERWYVGDARYWRAYNESQLGQDDAAWEDVELAAKLLVNAQVPKLAGILASRRHQLAVARAKLEDSYRRNPRDCETGFYLGLVLGDQREWTRAAEVLEPTASCLTEDEQRLTDDIERIRASGGPPERLAFQIARREQDLASDRRMLATSWFNTAVAYYALSRTDDARRFAEKVSDDERFGERARELLSRLR